jgi:hypothetical protein
MQLALIIWVCVIVEGRGSYVEVEGQLSKVESRGSKIVNVYPFYKFYNDFESFQTQQNN